MPSSRTLLSLLVASCALFGSAVAQNDDNIDGCYDSFGATYPVGPNPYQTTGACHKQCLAADKAVWAITKGLMCFCGDYVPTKGKVDMTQCNKPCPGYGQLTCGGDTTWVFGYTGALPPDIPKVGSTSSTSSKSSSSSTKTAVAIQTTVIVAANQATVTKAATEHSDTAPAQSKSSSNTAGVAAGIVVGVVAVIGISLGAYLVVRRNRRHRAEEEYKAAVAAKEFTSSIRKPMADARLDPVMVQHRRMSVGSIADNQDFSRRILKVTNPDNS